MGGGVEPFDGVFMDTANGDTFTGRIAYTPDAALTVSDSQVAFSSASAVSLDLKVNDDEGNALYNCFDYFDVDATFTVAAGAPVGVDMVETGIQANNALFYMFATQLFSHPSVASRVLNKQILNSTPRSLGPNFYNISGSASMRFRFVREGNIAKSITTYPGPVTDTVTKTMVLGTSDALPVNLQVPIIRFKQGTLTLTALKVTALYPNARFGFLGDSLTQGAQTGNYTDPFPQKIRADYPGDVIVCGAPSSTSTNWLAATRSFCQMKPRTAFVLLGANDISTGASEATIEANLTTIRSRLLAAGVRPVILTPSPMNNVKATNVATWVAAQGWDYIDIYTPLHGTGGQLNAAYSSGDGLHWNTAGHAVVYSAITAYIAAEGL